MDDTFIVYFDITRDFQVAWQGWIYVAALFGFFLLLICLPDLHIGARAVAGVGVAVGAIALCILLARSYEAKFVWPSMLQNNTSIVLEGPIENLSISPGGLNISFSVNGYRFEHFGRTDSEAYNLAKDPKRSTLWGKCVRIKMTKNHDILWFGVRSKGICESERVK